MRLTASARKPFTITEGAYGPRIEENMHPKGRGHRTGDRSRYTTR
jgi:hypothetical protein